MVLHHCTSHSLKAPPPPHTLAPAPQYDISEVANGGKPQFVSRVWIG